MIWLFLYSLCCDSLCCDLNIYMFRCLWIKISYTNTLLFFTLLGTATRLKTWEKRLRERGTKCSLKTTEVYWMFKEMCLPRFYIYQVTVTPNCLKSHTNSWCPDFFPKKVLSDVRMKFTLSDVTICPGLKKNLYSVLIDGWYQWSRLLFL